MPQEIDQLFNVLIEQKGSDLHLEEGQKPKIRIHGKLVEVGNDTLTREKNDFHYSLQSLSKKIGRNL